MRFRFQDNRHNRAFLKAGAFSEADFLKATEARYAAIAALPGKIKPVGSLKVAGQRVREFKLTLAGTDYRLAYVLEGDEAVILYASDQILKAAFTKKMTGLRF